MRLAEIDRIAMEFARRVEDRQPRADLTFSQLPGLGTATGVDLVPVYHVANGTTSSLQVNQLAMPPLVNASTGVPLSPTTGLPQVKFGNITAAGGSTTFTLTGSAFLQNVIYLIYDQTANTLVTTYTSYTLTQVVFPSTNTHVYVIVAIGW